jgi:hypothetical protein
MRPWNTLRVTAYGGAIGLTAALFKSFAPWSDPQSGAAIARELIGAMLAFALLCGLAAALRNFILRRMTGVRKFIKSSVGWASRRQSGEAWAKSFTRCPRRTNAQTILPTLQIDR